MYKLKNKGCDAIILNDVSKHDLGFKSDENEVMNESRDSLMNIHQTKKFMWRFIHNFQWNLLTYASAGVNELIKILTIDVGVGCLL
jgi:hypothetical protein